MKIEGIGFCTYEKHPMSVSEATCENKGKRCLSCDYFIDKKDFITVEEASKILGKSPSTIRKYIKEGKLEAEKCSYSEEFGSKWFKHAFYIIKRKSLET